MASTFTILLCHFIFSTKNRVPMISSSLEPELYRYIGGILRGEGATLIEIGGMPDHVHIVVQMKPTMAVANLMMHVKAGSSKWVNASRRLPPRFGWQDGYGAFTVSASQLAGVRAYVRNQAEHHRQRTFQEEFVEFLNRHGIEYEERYLWD